MKWVFILVAIPVLFYSIRWLIEPNYKMVDTKSGILEKYATSEDRLRDMDFYDRDLDLVKSYHELVPDNRRRVGHAFSNRFIAVRSGNFNYDDGLHYFFTPSYTFITIIDRKEMRMVKRLFFLEYISNMKFQDGKLYLYENRSIFPNRILALSLNEMGLIE